MSLCWRQRYPGISSILRTTHPTANAVPVARSRIHVDNVQNARRHAAARAHSPGGLFDVTVSDFVERNSLARLALFLAVHPAAGLMFLLNKLDSVNRDRSVLLVHLFVDVFLVEPGTAGEERNQERALQYLEQ